MFHAFLEDEREKREFARSAAILVGSFTNPEQAQKMLSKRKASSAESTEEYDQKSEDILREYSKQEGKRRRRKIKA